MRIEEKVYLTNGKVIKRYFVFTGDREGRIEDEAGNVTCLFSFETFRNVKFKSLKNGKLYETSRLPLDHAMFQLASAVHGAYVKRRELEWAA